jgi:hypothetical protein
VSRPRWPLPIPRLPPSPARVCRGGYLLLVYCWYAWPALHWSYTTSTSLHLSKQQVDVVFENECSKHMFLNVLEVCCKCFHMDATKVDRNISYVAMAVYICCKRMFQMFYLFFKRILKVCLSVCCICFTNILQVFYLDVAYDFVWILKCFQVFLQVFQTHVSSFRMPSNVNASSGCFKFSYAFKCQCFTWCPSCRRLESKPPTPAVTSGRRPPSATWSRSCRRLLLPRVAVRHQESNSLAPVATWGRRPASASIVSA